MKNHCLYHAVRGVEGIVSNRMAVAPGCLEAVHSVAALVTAQDRSGGGCVAIAVSACVLDVAVVATFGELDAMLEAVLRGSARAVIVSHPSALGDADMSACETFYALSALGVWVYAADRGWVNPDDFGGDIPDLPQPASVGPSDACVSPLEDCS